MHTINRGFNFFLLLWVMIFQTNLFSAARGNHIVRARNVSISTCANVKIRSSERAHYPEIGKTEWKCMPSGKCISKSFLCDGKKNCEDGSDETSKECKNLRCRSNEFQCKYGACVNKTAACNGVRDCFDGSDEDECSSPGVQIKTSSVISSISGDKSCEIPHSKNRNIVFIENGSDREINVPGLKAPKYAKIKITCKTNYVLPNKTKAQISICLSKQKWYPPIEACMRTCPRLRPVNVDVQCSFRGYPIDCRSELLIGTIVRPRCQALHRPEKEVDYRNRTMVCQENGQWSDELLKCVLDCGKQAPKPLVFNGVPETFGDAPWHAGIYKGRKNHRYICGGTLISANLILSSAHCFFDEVEGNALNESSNYEVGISKFKQNYTDEDDRYQKYYKVQDIIYSDVVFDPKILRQYSEDIVALVLKEPVEMSNYALPACIDWSASFQQAEDAVGKFVGWGDNIKLDQGSDILMTANLSFISYNRCVRLGKLNDLEMQFLSPDKFCTGFKENSPSGRKGDSGGGLVFRNPKNGRYYLRGVLSTADSEFIVTAFTDIYRHLDWLKNVHTRFSRES